MAATLLKGGPMVFLNYLIGSKDMVVFATEHCEIDRLAHSLGTPLIISNCFSFRRDRL